MKRKWNGHYESRRVRMHIGNTLVMMKCPDGAKSGWFQMMGELQCTHF